MNNSAKVYKTYPRGYKIELFVKDDDLWLLVKKLHDLGFEIKEGSP